MPAVPVQVGPGPQDALRAGHADGDEKTAPTERHLQPVPLPLVAVVVPQGEQEPVGLEGSEPHRDLVVLQVGLLVRHDHEVLVPRHLQPGGL